MVKATKSPSTWLKTSFKKKKGITGSHAPTSAQVQCEPALKSMHDRKKKREREEREKSSTVLNKSLEQGLNLSGS